MLPPLKPQLPIRLVFAQLRRAPDLATLDSASVQISRSMPKSAAAPLPTRLRLLRPGRNASTKGDFIVSDRTLRELPENQRKLGFETVAIDYNHTSAPGSENYVQGAIPPILGYGRPRVDAREGLVLEEIKWTPLGEEHARNFEDLSPALGWDKETGEVNFVHSVALTPNGALYGSEVEKNILPQTPQGQLDADKDHSGAKRAEIIRLAANLEVPESMLPDTLPLFPWGDSSDGSGWLTCNEVTLSELVQNQIRFGLLRVEILIPESKPQLLANQLYQCNECGHIWEHRAEGAPEKCPYDCDPSLPARVAGTGIPAVAQGNGLRLVDVKWTPDGRKAAAKFPFLKPNVYVESITSDGPDRGVIHVIKGLRSVEFSHSRTAERLRFPSFLKLTEVQTLMVGQGGLAATERLQELLLLRAGRSANQDLRGRARAAAAWNREFALQGADGRSLRQQLQPLAATTVHPPDPETLHGSARAAASWGNLEK